MRKKATRKGAKSKAPKRPARPRRSRTTHVVVDRATEVFIGKDAHPADIFNAMDKWARETSNALDSSDLAGILSAFRGPDFDHTGEEKIQSTGRVRAQWPMLVRGIQDQWFTGAEPLQLKELITPGSFSIESSTEPYPRKSMVNHFNSHIADAANIIANWRRAGKLKTYEKYQLELSKD